MNHVAVIDSKLCNLDSVRRALEECGGNVTIASNPSDLAKANRLVLPGVGTFPDGMRSLRENGMADAIEETVFSHNVPFLGLCLGMQLLGSMGHEVADTKGLGWIEGEVIRLQPYGQDVRIPHIGWNEVWQDRESPLFDGIPDGSDFYFVHSYHLKCTDPASVCGSTHYCGSFASVVQRDLVFGVQFHPEKSQKHGFRLLRNFLDL